ncbi:MAG: hypothetical protein OEW37_08750 [Rhodospirillaceae bacterium]|nr:hypothetical protein [Rhodospirillaceae bacterium]
MAIAKKIDRIKLLVTTIAGGKRYGRTSVLSVKEDDLTASDANYLVNIGKAEVTEDKRKLHAEDPDIVARDAAGEPAADK